MTSLLEHAGVRSRDKPHALASLLGVSHRPVSLMFRDTFGVTLRLGAVDRSGQRGLDDREASYLDLPPGTLCRWRTGRLVTAAGDLAAGVFLLWLPGALDDATLAALDAGEEPAGLILSRLPGGMVRERPEALASPFLDEVTGHDAALKSRAVLVCGGEPAGLAEECWMAAFAESLP